MKANNGFTVVIDIRNKEGRKIGEKEVATYQGLLAKAHEEGLRRVITAIVQVPTKENGETAIVRAMVLTNRGTFTGLGDANPTNVKRTIAGHIIRMAETRAKARALRDAVNIGIVALEELGELVEDEPAGERRGPPAPFNAPGGSADGATARVSGIVSTRQADPMSDAQRRLLLRLAQSRGVPAEEAETWIGRELKIQSLASLTIAEASRCIRELQGGAKNDVNGHNTNGTNGVDAAR